MIEYVVSMRDGVDDSRLYFSNGRREDIAARSPRQALKEFLNNNKVKVIAIYEVMKPNKQYKELVCWYETISSD